MTVGECSTTAKFEEHFRTATVGECSRTATYDECLEVQQLVSVVDLTDWLVL